MLDLVSFILGQRLVSPSEFNERLPLLLASPVLHALGSTEESLQLWIAPADINLVSTIG